MTEDSITRICATCRYRSDEFTSVCVNPDSPKCADFVIADDACMCFKKKEGDEKHDKR